MNPLIWIDPGAIRFYRHPDGWLAARWEERQGPVAVKRLFPVSDPEGAVSIRDLRGDEWGLLRSVRELAPDSREAVESELRMNPYFPRIQAITSLRRRQQHLEWQVLTDFGPGRFSSAPLYESVMEWPEGQRVVTDLTGQSYLLPPDKELGGKSLRWLKRWL